MSFSKRFITELTVNDSFSFLERIFPIFNLLRYTIGISQVKPLLSNLVNLNTLSTESHSNEVDHNLKGYVKNIQNKNKGYEGAGQTSYNRVEILYFL